MADNARVRFIRRRGRVIPIREPQITKQGKRDFSDLTKGTAAIATGTAIGIASGKAYEKSMRHSLDLKLRGARTIEKLKSYKKRVPKDLFSYGHKEKQVAKAVLLSRNAIRSGRAVGRLTPGFRIGGQLAASSLIGYGAAKVYKAAHKKAEEGEVATVATAASTGAYALGMQGRAGVKGIAKDFAVAMSPGLRKLKGRLRR